jgi:hypothetical protein
MQEWIERVMPMSNLTTLWSKNENVVWSQKCAGQGQTVPSMGSRGHLRAGDTVALRTSCRDFPFEQTQRESQSGQESEFPADPHIRFELSTGLYLFAWALVEPAFDLHGPMQRIFLVTDLYCAACSQDKISFSKINIIAISVEQELNVK